MKTTTAIDELLTRGIAEVIDREHLQLRLVRGDKLRVKLGIDPTGSRLHLGHVVVLRLLRRFQNLGHTVVLIIGDTTALIGDPSGKNETRPALSQKDIAKNLATYERQALTVLDRKRLEFRWQSEWYKEFNLNEVVREASKLSAGWITSHDTFRNRLKNGQPLAFHELLYPLIQAYDSVAVRADVEIGGLDQKFNILTGRELMRAHGLEPQDVVLAKYLIGTDGQKMGKSLGNFIALEEEPPEMFGKIMRMPDNVLRDFYELVTEVPMAEVNRMQLVDIGARDAKLKLAATLVETYHGTQKSKLAVQTWAQRYASKITTITGTSSRAATLLQNQTLRDLVATELKISKSEAQRKFEQNGVTLDKKIEGNWRLAGHDFRKKSLHLLIVGKKKQPISFIIQ